MKFMELVMKRQSDRSYINKPVEKEKLEQCLEAARMAPSASNSQPWTFVVVNDPVLVKKVAHKTYGPLKSFNKFVPQAPVIVAIVMEPPKLITEVGGRIKKKEYPLIDVGIAAEHFCLQATELGLGTCMLGWFDEKSVKELIRVPENKNIPLLIAVGYTPDDYKKRKKIRKDFSKVVRYNYYH
ncbi:MAG: NAD(P)H nitroreductase [Chlorobi bacterium]|nr:NAD(P)H nitroreductase [Chlorobiota bacterium]